MDCRLSMLNRFIYQPYNAWINSLSAKGEGMRSGRIILASGVILLLMCAMATAEERSHTRLAVAAKAGYFWFDQDRLSEDLEGQCSFGVDFKWWPTSLNEFLIGAEIQYLKKQIPDILDTTQFTELRQIPIHVDIFFNFAGISRSTDDSVVGYCGIGPSIVFADCAKYVMEKKEENGQVSSKTLKELNDYGIGFNAIVGLQYRNFFIEGQYLHSRLRDIDIQEGEGDPFTGGFSLWVGVRF